VSLVEIRIRSGQKNFYLCRQHRDRIFIAFYREFSAILTCWFMFSADCVPQLIFTLNGDQWYWRKTMVMIMMKEYNQIYLYFCVFRLVIVTDII